MSASDAIALRTLYLIAVLFGAGFLVAGALALVSLRKDAGARVKNQRLWWRGLTLAVLAPLVLLPCYWGMWPFAAVIAGIIVAGLWEFRGFLKARQVRFLALAGYASGLGMLAAALLYGERALFLCAAGVTAAFAAAAVIDGAKFGSYAGTWCGVIYVAYLSSFMLLIRGAPGGFGKAVFFLLIIQLADIGGLFGGLAAGRHKLVPHLSPGKTWEGVVIGTLAAAATGLLFRFAIPGRSAVEAIVLAVLFSISALFGDLFASLIKRLAGLKDFGKLLGAHGGVLDRFDSYLISAPIAWMLMRGEHVPGGHFATPALIAAALIALIVLLNRIYVANRRLRR